MATTIGNAPRLRCDVVAGALFGAFGPQSGCRPPLGRWAMGRTEQRATTPLSNRNVIVVGADTAVDATCILTSHLLGHCMGKAGISICMQ